MAASSRSSTPCWRRDDERDTQIADRLAEQGEQTAPNPHRSFIWYELITPDPDASARFYGKIVGWAARSAGMKGFDYRLLSIGGIDVHRRLRCCAVVILSGLGAPH